MTRTITVKGTGTVSERPDQIRITINLESMDKAYDKAFEQAAAKANRLSTVLQKAGLAADALKTVRLDTSARYEYIKNKRTFTGYVCSQTVAVELDMDMKMLGRVLSGVAECTAEPDMSIRFTVKEPARISEELLRDAAENARKKAEILCAASGVALGELISVTYDWNELNVMSNSRLGMEYLQAPGCCMEEMDFSFEPEDISVTDSVTFVWTIC